MARACVLLASLAVVNGGGAGRAVDLIGARGSCQPEQLRVGDDDGLVPPWEHWSAKYETNSIQRRKRLEQKGLEARKAAEKARRMQERLEAQATAQAKLQAKQPTRGPSGQAAGQAASQAAGQAAGQTAGQAEGKAARQAAV